MNNNEMKLVAEAMDHIYSAKHLIDVLSRVSKDKDILSRISDIRSALFVLFDRMDELVDVATSENASNRSINPPRSLENDSDGKLSTGDEN